MKKTIENQLRLLFDLSHESNRRGGGLVSIVGWLIRVVIYDICVTTISEVLGVSRLVALFIFLGILGAISFVGYLMKQRMSPSVDS